MDLGLIAGVVGAAAGVVAALLAFLQLRAASRVKPAEPWPVVEPSEGLGIHRPAPASDPSNAIPSAADFGLPVRVLTERLPTHVRGRGNLLSRLNRHLTQGGLVVLTGSGGMGKSTVARQLVRQMPAPGAGQSPRPVWEVSAADSSSLIGGLITIAASLGAAESDLQAISIPTPSGPDRFWRLLEERSAGWLLIIDNADRQELLAAPAATGGTSVPRLHDNTGWVRATTKGLVLVTSRRREDRQAEGLLGKNQRNAIWPDEAILYEVGPLSDSEAADVLLDWAPMAGSRDQARKLGHRLGGLPLVLRLVGQYLTSGYVRNPTFTAYLNALDSDPRIIRLLDPDLDDPERVEREMVMFTWEMSLDALADYGMPQARGVLRLLSCYAPVAPIPLSLLTSELRPLLSIPDEHSTSEDADYAKINQILRGLDHLGLIESTRLPDNKATIFPGKTGGKAAMPNGQHALVIHPVIADTNRVYLLEPTPSDPDPVLVRSTAVRLLASALDTLISDRPGDWPAFRILIPHVQALLANSASSLDDNARDALALAAGHTATAYGQMRSPEFGLELARSALSLTSRRTGTPSPAALVVRQQLAHLLVQVGNSAEAERIYRSVLNSQKRLWPDDDPAVLATRLNLGTNVAAQPERSAEAYTILRELLEDERRVLGEDDEGTLTTRLQLAMLKASRGRELPEAEGDLKDLLLNIERVFGPDDQLALVVRYNLAHVIFIQGRQSEAERILRDLLADAKRVLGDDHFVTSAARNFNERIVLTSSTLSTPKIRENYAARLLDKGLLVARDNQWAEAIEVWRSLIARFDNDPDLALGRLAAKAAQLEGFALAKLGRQAEAIASLERAVDRYTSFSSLNAREFEKDLGETRQLLAEVKRLAAGSGSAPDGS